MKLCGLVLFLATVAVDRTWCEARHLSQAPGPAPGQDTAYLPVLRADLQGDKLQSGNLGLLTHWPLCTNE